MTAPKFGDPRLPQRFWSKVAVAETGCWEWIASRHGNGYGHFKVGRVGTLTHRLAYTSLIGPIPDDLELDHLCRNRACCNPEHLEPVTHAENMRRGIGPEASRERQRAKTRCPQGHPYSGQNLYTFPDGRRGCRTCGRAARRTRYQREKATA